MFATLLPQRIDNTYHGYRLALWLFALVVALKVAQSVSVFVGGASVVTAADGVALDTYPPAAAQTIMSLFELRAVSRLIACMLCLLVLARYRSAIPFAFVLLILNYLGDQAILQFVPIVRTGTPPAPVVNLVSFGVMIVGLALSLRKGEAVSRD